MNADQVLRFMLRNVRGGEGRKTAKQHGSADEGVKAPKQLGTSCVQQALVKDVGYKWERRRWEGGGGKGGAASQTRRGGRVQSSKFCREKAGGSKGLRKGMRTGEEGDGKLFDRNRILVGRVGRPRP